jgi:hypothetical protein
VGVLPMETTATATTTELIETGVKHDVLGRKLTPDERRKELLRRSARAD